MTTTEDTPSYSTTAFKGGVAAWLGAITLLIASQDHTIRVIGAVGLVGLPALFMLTNALVKRAALKGSGGGGLLSLASSLLGGLPSSAPPAVVPEVPTLEPCGECSGTGVAGGVGVINDPERRSPCQKCAGTGLAQAAPK